MGDHFDMPSDDEEYVPCPNCDEQMRIVDIAGEQTTWRCTACGREEIG